METTQICFATIHNNNKYFLNILNNSGTVDILNVIIYDQTDTPFELAP